MSQQEPNPIYCDAQDVGDLINQEITETTSPSKTQVIKLINGNQDEIDRKTKHAWREVSVLNEVHDLEGAWMYSRGFEVSLHHRKIRALDYTKGDRVQFWNTNEWQNVLPATGSMDSTVDVELEMGIISFRSFIWGFTTRRRFRISYRYGETVVPAAIRKLCAKMTALEIVSGSMFWNNLPTGGDRFSITDTHRLWKEDIDATIADFGEITAIH